MLVYNVKKEKLFIRMQLSFLTNIKLKKLKRHLFTKQRLKRSVRMRGSM